MEGIWYAVYTTKAGHMVHDIRYIYILVRSPCGRWPHLHTRRQTALTPVIVRCPFGIWPHLFGAGLQNGLNLYSPPPLT